MSQRSSSDTYFLFIGLNFPISLFCIAVNIVIIITGIVITFAIIIIIIIITSNPTTIITTIEPSLVTASGELLRLFHEGKRGLLLIANLTFISQFFWFQLCHSALP